MVMLHLRNQYARKFNDVVIIQAEVEFSTEKCESSKIGCRYPVPSVFDFVATFVRLTVK